MKKILVAYFSATSVTKALAERLAGAVGADIREIRPAVPYTEADLDWHNEKSRSSLEMADPRSRPALADSSDTAGPYDALLVGFPIWWYVAPRIVDTFLEAQSLKGKTVVPFATSGSSFMEKVNADLAPACRGARLLEGRRFEAQADEAELRAWVASLGL